MEDSMERDQELWNELERLMPANKRVSTLLTVADMLAVQISAGAPDGEVDESITIVDLLAQRMKDTIRDIQRD